MFKKFLASLTLFKYEPLQFQFTLMNFYSDSFCSKKKPCITPCHTGGSGSMAPFTCPLGAASSSIFKTESKAACKMESVDKVQTEKSPFYTL